MDLFLSLHQQARTARDLRLKRFNTSIGTSCTLQNVRNCNNVGAIVVDRLSHLPDELLIRILSLLPTKDAAATCVLSRKMRRIFPWIVSLDFDDSPISNCLKYPFGIERLPTYETFVDTVLHGYQSSYLTSFRLGVGMGFFTRYFFGACRPGDGGCMNSCLPDLNAMRINAWISFPLTRCGLKELDLRVNIREPGDAQMPPEIFTCETLQVLKLDVNLGFDRVSTFRLPNLKVLYLHASFISEDGFVTRLVSSCPLLEDLTVAAWWNHVHFTSISSPSLRRLYLEMQKLEVIDNTDYVLINTPNLEDLYYYDNIASQYSVQYMYCLAKAVINIGYELQNETLEVSYQQLLKLIRPLSNVHHLSLHGACTWPLNFVEVKDQLPVFPHLKHLELGNNCFAFWDNVLLAFLNCSPILETLVFPEGLVYISDFDSDWENLELERKLCRTAQITIPQCCRSNLKRIVIKKYIGKEREVDLIQFLLRNALVLEELVIYQFKSDIYPIADQMELEDILRNLPRASVTCSIQVK